MADLFDLSGKVALVTGGSRGLGYQMVKAFAAHGADVFITSRKIDACEKPLPRSSGDHLVACWNPLPLRGGQESKASAA